MRASAVALALCLASVLALATADEVAKPAYDYKPHYEPHYEPHYDPHYEHHEPYQKEPYNEGYHSIKTITLYTKDGPIVCPDVAGADITCPGTFGITRTLWADAAKTSEPVQLYQTGVVAVGGSQNTLTTGDIGTGRLIWHQSFRFPAGNRYGEGTIQTQGDDTGPDDTNYANRAIIGGTGVFTGVKGYLSRAANGAQATRNPGNFVFYITNWNGYGYDK